MEFNNLFEKITLPTFSDPRGDMTVFDNIDQLIDWPIKRSYWATNTKLPRGGHCVKGEKKIYVMAQGSCLAKLYDGENWYEINLQGPNQALWLKGDMWREFTDFSEHSVMFTLCNMHYEKDKYILDLKEFDQYILNKNS